MHGGSRWLKWARDPEHRRRVALLRAVPLFTGLRRRLLDRLATRFFEKGYGAGDTVFYEGEPGRALFVVLEGAVAISQATADDERVIRTLGPGACFGEMALIDDFPRSATVRVTAPSRLLILYKSDFDALVEGHSRIALLVQRNLLRMLAAYVRSATPARATPAADPPSGGDGAAGVQAPP